MRGSLFLEKLHKKVNLGTEGAECPGNYRALEQADHRRLPVYRPRWEAVPGTGIVPQ